MTYNHYNVLSLYITNLGKIEKKIAFVKLKVWLVIHCIDISHIAPRISALGYRWQAFWEQRIVPRFTCYNVKIPTFGVCTWNLRSRGFSTVCSLHLASFNPLTPIGF